MLGFSGRILAMLLGAVLFSGFTAGTAYAVNDLSDIAQNVVTSGERLPGLITGLSYLLAIMFGILGIIKMRDHVENPSRTQLHEPLIRFAAGGALLALPIIYEAMVRTIGGGAAIGGGGVGAMAAIQAIGGLLGSAMSYVPLNDFNQVLAKIIESVERVPGLIAGIGYLLGLVMGVSGILKLKEHIENPQQTGLREGVIRLLIGGALIALPAIYSAMFETIRGGGGLGVGGALAAVLSGGQLLVSTEDIGANCATNIIASVGGLVNQVSSALGFGNVFSGGPGIGAIICNLMLHSFAFPAFLTAISYLFGLVLGVWGLLKIKDHVLNPQQTSVWEGVSRLLAGGAFFALPVVVTAAYNTVAEFIIPHLNSGFSGATSAGGLDAVMAGFMADILGPLDLLFKFFAFSAGIVLVMIGISRLLKSAQEGARGPGGIGTIMTFIIGGALLSFGPMITAGSMSLFGSPLTTTTAQLQYVQGLNGQEVQHVHAVISAIIKFMIVLGLASFLRGLFIMRAVAEGNSQASMIAGVTHIIGGALAVNLGPLINAVQNTLGIGQYGILFS